MVEWIKVDDAGGNYFGLDSRKLRRQDDLLSLREFKF